MYAAKLGFEVSYFDTTKLQVIDSKASGYMVASNAGSKLIFDAANIGPDYIPGHAHADTLSFELSIGDERVFVNLLVPLNMAILKSVFKNGELQLTIP